MPFLTDGYQTTVSCDIVGPNGRLGVVLREREVQPPGVDLGGPIDTATMRSVGYRTKNPASLKNIDDIVMQCQYDPAAYFTIINSFMGVIGTWTVVFPDGATTAFFGWLESFKPASHKEKDMPLAEVKICLTPDMDITASAFGTGTPTFGLPVPYTNPAGTVSTPMLSPRDALAAARRAM